MPLTLTLRAGVQPVPPLRLDGRGAVIGRAAEADWCLPDPRQMVSARHCEIAHRDGAYVLVDRSTNGTSVNGRRLTSPHRLATGDVIAIGDYQAAVSLDAAGASPAPRASAPATPGAGAGFAAFLHAAGLDRAQVHGDEAGVMAAAGGLLRRLVTGLRDTETQRVKARGEIGVAPVPADNPVTAARSPELALALLLSPPQPGATPPREAIDSLADATERHRVAVLKAMQAVLGKAVDRFSPAAIRARARPPGVLARLLPGGAEATLWREYERGFGSGDDGFVGLFAEEYRLAYAALAGPGKGETMAPVSTQK